MFKRKKTKKIYIGNVGVGGDSPISVQSMCNTDTRDVKATVKQINNLTEAGCELIRLAIPDKIAADAVKDIKKQIKIPLIADIHFDYRLAIKCIENGIDALRLNPGNIGKDENVKKVATLAKQHEIPIRIGINAGSLEKNIKAMDASLPEKMVLSAKHHIQLLEENDFNLIKVSLKSSDVVSTIEAYRLMSQEIDYPLHLGITEAGTLRNGLVKSSVGLGTLLAEGIGDTIRISLTENPIEEVKAGYEILRALNLKQQGINFISCPTCGRTQIDLINLAKQVENRLKDIKEPLTIAVMGCAVNGPGEASSADFGIAGGIGEGYIFKKGVVLERINEENLLSRFEEIVRNYLEEQNNE